MKLPILDWKGEKIYINPLLSIMSSITNDETFYIIKIYVVDTKQLSKRPIFHFNLFFKFRIETSFLIPPILVATVQSFLSQVREEDRESLASVLEDFIKMMETNLSNFVQGIEKNCNQDLLEIEEIKNNIASFVREKFGVPQEVVKVNLWAHVTNNSVILPNNFSFVKKDGSHEVKISFDVDVCTMVKVNTRILRESRRRSRLIQRIVRKISSTNIKSTFIKQIEENFKGIPFPQKLKEIVLSALAEYIDQANVNNELLAKTLNNVYKNEVKVADFCYKIMNTDIQAEVIVLSSKGYITPTYDTFTIYTLSSNYIVLENAKKRNLVSEVIYSLIALIVIILQNENFRNLVLGRLIELDSYLQSLIHK
ncbi:MAG: hypothetical protein QXV35_04070 [Archaeoglobaceae archaeon]